MVRVPFESVFIVHSSGLISPRAPVQVGGIRMGPGVSFGRGAIFAGVELAALVGHELEVTYLTDGVTQLLGVY